MMQRGEVWVANLDPNRGGEIGKPRPVVILQNDRLLSLGLPTIVTLPLTTQYREALAPLRIRIAARDRLPRNCHVMIEHPRALDYSRFGEGPLTMLTAEEMAAVEQGLKTMLGLS